MTVDELRRKSNMGLRELAFKKVSAAMRPWMRRRHRGSLSSADGRVYRTDQACGS